MAEEKQQQEWQEILLKESNGVKLWERGVGVYTVEYEVLGKRHEPVFLDWNQALASFENHASQI